MQVEYLHYTDKVGKFVYESKLTGKTNREIIEELEYMYDKRVSGEDGRQIRRWHERYKREHEIEVKVAREIAPYPDFGEHDNWYNIQELFENYITANYKRNSPVTIGIICDEHLPDENELAMRLSIQLLNIAKPQILIHNGDIHDLSTESKYPNSHRDMATDFLEMAWRKFDNYRLLYEYDPVMELLVSGNHDDRYPKALGGNSASTRNSALRDFKYQMDKRNLLFGGWNCHHLQYNRDLLVQHEGSTGVNAARGSLLNAGYGFLLSVFAHAHKVQTTSQTSLAGEHVSIISGCIANKIPQYNKKFVQNWQYGMVFVTMLGDNIAPLWQDVKYSEVGNRMKCLFGGEVVEVG